VRGRRGCRRWRTGPQHVPHAGYAERLPPESQLARAAAVAPGLQPAGPRACDNSPEITKKTRENCHTCGMPGKLWMCDKSPECTNKTRVNCHTCGMPGSLWVFDKSPECTKKTREICHTRGMPGNLWMCDSSAGCDTPTGFFTLKPRGVPMACPCLPSATCTTHSATVHAIWHAALKLSSWHASAKRTASSCSGQHLLFVAILVLPFQLSLW
jgi:hypothetical protein